MLNCDVSAVLLDSVFSFLVVAGTSSFNECFCRRLLLASATFCFGSFGFLVDRSVGSSTSSSINRFSRLAVRTAFESSAVTFVPCAFFRLLTGDRLDVFFELGDLRCARVVCFFGECLRDSSETLETKHWFLSAMVLLCGMHFTYLSATSSTGSRRHSRSSDLMIVD